MTVQTLLSTLRRSLLPAGRSGGLLRLHHLGMSEADLRQLRPLVAGAAEQLGVPLVLDAEEGDIVVVERGFADHLTSQALRDYCADRPLVAIDVAGSAADALESVLHGFEQCQRDLLSQLSDLSIVQRKASNREVLKTTTAPGDRPRLAPGSDFDPGFDSRLDGVPAPLQDPQQQALLKHMVAGLSNPSLPGLVLGYGPGACMAVDFASGRVSMDAIAQQRLRIGCELPGLAPPGARVGAHATERALDLVVWDLGLACGDHRLQRQPDDWWHTVLRADNLARLERYTRLPRHLEIARRLLDGPATPSQLRRHALVSVHELRRFLQACLFLDLLNWAPGPSR